MIQYILLNLGKNVWFIHVAQFDCKDVTASYLYNALSIATTPQCVL